MLLPGDWPLRPCGQLIRPDHESCHSELLYIVRTAVALSIHSILQQWLHSSLVEGFSQENPTPPPSMSLARAQLTPSLTVSTASRVSHV